MRRTHSSTARSCVAGIGLALCLAAALPGGAALAQGAAPAPPAPVQRAPGEREAVIQNDTGLTIRALYVFPNGIAEPGPDRLGGGILAAGQQFRARLGRYRECSFDIRAVLADGTVQERAQVDLCVQRRVAFGDAGAPLREATVANDTDLALRELYARLPNQTERGPDRLGTSTIAPGATFRLGLGRTRDCVFDLTAVFEDDSTEDRSGIDLCREQRIGFGDPSVPTRAFTLRNASTRVIQQFYASSTANDNWGPDRLGAAVLPAGESFAARVRSAECTLDLRAVFEGGSAEERRNVDVCAAPEQAFDGSTLPQPAAPPEREAQPERRFTVLNRIGTVVQELYVSSAEDDDWGPDRLGDTVLERERRQQVTLNSACEVDLRIVFASGGAEERRGIDICVVDLIVLRPGWTWAERLDDGAGPAPSDAPVRPGGVRFRNAAGVPVVELYADAPGAARGPDRLGATVLGAGEGLDYVPTDGVCIADVTAIFRDGRELRLPAAELCDAKELTLR